MRLALGFSTVLLTVCATVAVPLVAAGETRMPTIPDNNQAQEHTRITVTTESGEPVTGPVHRGDVLLVHGSGFDPQANKGGFPIPVPPGTPNGCLWCIRRFLSGGSRARMRQNPTGSTPMIGVLRG